MRSHRRVDLEAQETYWRNRLGDDVRALELHLDHPRPPVPAFLRASASHIFDVQLCQQINSLCGRANSMLDVVLLAVFETLLLRYTGREKFVVCSLTSDCLRRLDSRTPETSTNAVVLYADLSGNPSFLELLARVARSVGEAATDGEYSSEEQHDRSIEQASIPGVMFVVVGVPALVSAEPLTKNHLDDGAEFLNQCDLVFLLNSIGETFSVTCEYDAELFEADTIHRALGHYETLLRGIIARPHARLSQLPLLTESESRQLILEWNDTKTDDPKERCVHELFETQVERTPEAIAVAFEDQQLSYRELNNRANQLAHRLRKLGVGPEVLVGIRVERSIEMVIGLLGILKAGGAYLPLDPAYPKERLAFMLEDSGASVLLTQGQLGELEPNFSGIRISLDQDWQGIARESATNVDLEQDSDNLAYVIYTSGSTGVPKGVMIQHGSVVNCLASMARAPGLSEADIFLAVTTLSFDMAALEIYLPLTVGARLVVARREVASDGLRLARQLSDCGATVMQATPATWRMLSASGWQGNLGLKVFCGGEALADDLSRQLACCCASLWNLYGPTETTIYSTAQRVAAKIEKVTLGRPIANTQLYILDGNLQPVPIGVPGEIHIGGDGLARGYLNRPDLTAEKFIADPFGRQPASRLYKTGDLARYLPDGSIEFLGRMDHQVKIRGYRIELGEIEATLAQHRSIKESVVLARDDSPGSRRLVAYIVAALASVPSITELRRFLLQKLPEYMVPSVFVFLDAMPLTSNGKLDRKALPHPDQRRPSLGDAYCSPETPVEELLARIWAEVLTLDRVGTHDDFFALGGDSLRAIQIVARLRKLLNQELAFSDILANGTIAELARLVTERSAKTSPFAEESVQLIKRDRRLPLSFSQERLWFIQQLYPANIAYHFQSLFYFTGRLNVNALERSLGEIVRRHAIYRTAFPEVDGNPIQDIHPPFPVSLPVLDLQDLPVREREAELQKRITEETRKPFDLGKLPLVRWTLARISSDEFVLIHVEHHLVHDGWSFNVFRRELLELYKAFSTGGPSPLPDPTLQFADFALWQRRWMEGETAKRQLAYWKRQLSDSPTTLALAADHSRPPVPSFRGAAPRFAISPALGDSLRALGRERGATLFMTLFTAFVALLYRYTRQEEICVGTGVGNRHWQESEGLLGMLVNNVVLRIQLGGDPKFIDLLDQVRATALDAYDNGDIPFDHVVRALNIERDDSRNPLFQAMFNFHDAPLREPVVPGTRIRCEEVISNQSAKFDLNVIVIPRSQPLADGASANGITLIWEYNSDLFESITMERMARHYFRLLEEIVADPFKRVSEYSMVSEQETQELVRNFNRAPSDYPAHACIQELFEAQAEKNPDAIAVVFEDQQLSYRELNSRANQLARYLQKLGAGPDVLVGICMERSIEMVVGLLGILKAGGAYVPLDPGYPKERLAAMLEDTQAGIVLTEVARLPLLPSTRARMICLDRDWEEISREPKGNLTHRSTADSLAYVIFTSGSTGVPKGVEVRHRGIVRLLFGVDYVRLDRAQTVLHAAPISFDAATFEVWGALLHGGKCVVFPGKIPNAEELRDVLKEHQVTILWLTAALFNSVIDETPQALARVEQLLIGGEALSVPHVRKGLARLPNTEMINGYGPTESTTFTCCYPIPRQLDDNLTSIPIGKPLGNTQVYILDPHLQPVPVGVAGELHIGGDGLARGYLNRPELTREKFIANPFSTDTTGRLYKTGDLARYLPDGNIEFLGRIDDQVKIRGYRIELGEIEAVLRQHRDIQSAVVTLREDTPGDKRLVGYVVARKKGFFDAADARKHLKRKLPEYMIPATLMLLNDLPLMPSGKIDRRALPPPDQVRPELADVYQPPRAPTEDTLARIWAEVLGLNEVGIHDNFFQLGGHSLLATQIVSRIRNAFLIELPLRRLFESPTVAEMAEIIAESQGNRAVQKKLAEILHEVEASTGEKTAE